MRGDRQGQRETEMPRDRDKKQRHPETEISGERGRQRDGATRPSVRETETLTPSGA